MHLFGLKNKQMDIKRFITEWIAASNSFNTEKYLSFYLPEAILDDVSLGIKFERYAGIKDYFDKYFMGYNTHTEEMRLMDMGQEHVHLEVRFTGDFPEGKIWGTFDFKFKNGKILFLKADLL